MHDFNHPGTTNAHEIGKDSHLAIRYHDESVLESHHLACAFTALLTPQHNFLESWDRKAYVEFRKLVVQLVMLTDLSRHFDFISTLNASAPASLTPTRENAASGTVVGGVATGGTAAGGTASGGTAGGGTAANGLDAALILSVALKAADIGHAVKSWELHHMWTLRVTQEFFELGDRERAAGLPISPFCDRHKDVNLAKSQVGFMQFVCLPFYVAVERVMADATAAIAVARLKANIDAWSTYDERSEVPDLQA